MSGRRRPADWVASGQWPNATLAAGAPPAAGATQRIARLVAEMIEDAGWTVPQTAEAAELHPRTIQRLLAGQRYPDPTTVLSLLAALDGHWVLPPEPIPRQEAPRRFNRGRARQPGDVSR